MGTEVEHADVVVVGGGPAGSVAAALLAATGRQVVLLEREAQERPIGAGILLQPNGLAVLYAMGLREALGERGREVREAPLYDERGRTLAEMRMPDFGRGLDHGLVLRRSHLKRVLDRHLATSDRIEVRRDALVRSATGDGAIAYEHAGSPRELLASLVIGADGVGSRVRRTGDFRARPIERGHAYARMIVDAEPTMPGVECWSGLGLFGSAALGDGSTYAYASVGHPDVQATIIGRCGRLRRPLVLGRAGGDTAPRAPHQHRRPAYERGGTGPLWHLRRRARRPDR